MHFFFAYYPYICITLLLAGLQFNASLNDDVSS